MITQKDGGPAFPGPEGLQGYGNQIRVDGPNGPEWIACNQGMSLRDYFAAAAMSETPPGYFNELSDISRRAYQLADAMLAERAKGGAQ